MTYENAKMFKKLAVIYGIMALVVFSFIFYQSHKRAVIAQSWSSDEVQVHAEGLVNLTLVATPVNGDEVPCPFFIHDVTEDTRLTAKMRTYGFVEIQCGKVRANLR